MTFKRSQAIVQPRKQRLIFVPHQLHLSYQDVQIYVGKKGIKYKKTDQSRLFRLVKHINQFGSYRTV